MLVAQAAGAFNDNLLRNALAVLAVFGADHRGPAVPALAGAVLIAPCLLVSAHAGALADRVDKTAVVRAARVAELGLMVGAAFALGAGSIPALLAVLLGLGIEAAVFGPTKYALLPERLAPASLNEANGLMEAATFAAILGGTLAGGGLIERGHGPAIVAVLGLGCAVLGLVAAFVLPRGPIASEARIAIGANPVRATVALVGAVRRDPVLWHPILGLSWFWLLGASIVAEFPSIVRSSLGGDPSVNTLMLGAFTVGTGAGALGCAPLVRWTGARRLPVIALLGITVCLGDLAVRSAGGAPALRTAGAMLGAGRGWGVLADLFGLAASGGLFSVLLFSRLQAGAAAAHRARVIAANNVVNAAAIIAGAVAVALAAAVGASPAATLGGFAVANGVVALRAAWPTRRA